MAGTTQSPNFPTTTGAFDRTGAAQNFADVFVTKLNPAGTALVYSTFVGGSDMEFGHGMAIDGSGNAYVTGQTKSSNFPTTGGAFDRTLNIPGNCPRCGIDNTDNFVFKLNAAGSALRYSTYLGGTDYDAARGIAVDGSGNAYVTGETLSADYPDHGGRVRPDAGRPVRHVRDQAQHHRLGARLLDVPRWRGRRQRRAGDGRQWRQRVLLGFTSSTDFPTTAGTFDTTANGAFDATLTKLNAAGSALVYSTYLGGNDFDGGSGLIVDSAGNAYVTGGTPSANFPTTPGAYDRTFNNGDAFLTKFNAAGSALVFSTFVGGSDFDSFSAVVLDTAGNAWLTGGTSSADFPITAGAPDSTFNGGGDATIAELNSTGSALLFSTFLGGSQSEGGADIARDAERRCVRHGQHVLAGLPGHRRSLRPGLERRPPDLLGRCLHHQARHRRQRIHSDRAAGRAGAHRHWCRRSTPRHNRSRSRSTGTMPPARCRTPSRSTTPARSPRRSSVSRP